MVAAPTTIAASRSAARFRLYEAGRQVAGLPLTAKLTRGRATTFIYGTCSLLPCAPPVEIENYPLCSRNLGSYRPPAEPPPRSARRRVRGAPAAVFGQGEAGPGDAIDRLEIYTSTTTIVIDASPLSEALRVAAALRSTDGQVTPARPLPPADNATLIGGGACNKHSNRSR